MRRSWIVVLCVLVAGVVLLVLGAAVLRYVFEQKIHDQVLQKVPLVNGSESFDAWMNPPSTIYLQFWLFDVVNGNEVMKNGDKPILEQKGPYTYREIRPRDKVKFMSQGTRIRFIQPKSYVFVPDMSPGTEDDVVTTVNFPIMALATAVRYVPENLQHMLGTALSLLGERLFHNYTVHEYLWGFEEPVLKEVNKVTKFLFNVTIKNDVFGLFYGPTGNGSNDGEYIVNTGLHDISEFNNIVIWKNQSNLSWWNTPYCNMINGSDGSGFHPFIKKDETLYLFASDICRSIHLNYQEDHSVRDIPVLRFVPPPDVFASVEENPDNIGFCTPDCLLAGVLNVSSCRQGVPLVVSQPHFFQGDPRYIDGVSGMHPDPLQHQTHLDVEPLTGAPLSVAKKLQLNFYIRHLQGFPDTLKLSNSTIFPVLWLNESGLVSPEGASKLQSTVLQPILILHIILYLLMGLGALLIIIALVAGLVICLKGHKNDDTSLKSVTDDDSSTRGLLEDEQQVSYGSHASHNSTVNT